jgi:lipoprotein-anchoring transpeptidase ErfK/SrfK
MRLLRSGVLLTAAASALGVTFVLGPDRHRHPQIAALAPPPPPQPGLKVPAPVPLHDIRGLSTWAPVRRATIARTAPSSGAPAVLAVSALTPEGTTNIVELLGGVRRGPGGLWQHVRLSGLPNGLSGWVPDSTLGGSVEVDTKLVVDRERFTATLTAAGKRIFTAPVGIGRPQSPTPSGSFYVRDVLSRFASPRYGPVAFGTSARSPTLTDWPAGGYVGIHGTDDPAAIPGAISHGCIRMRNFDILRLARLMPIGTPVIVR